MRSYDFERLPEVCSLLDFIECLEEERVDLNEHLAKTLFDLAESLKIATMDFGLQAKLDIARALYWWRLNIPAKLISEAVLGLPFGNAFYKKMFAVDLPCRCNCGQTYFYPFSSRDEAKKAQAILRSQSIAGVHESFWEKTCQSCASQRNILTDAEKQRIAMEIDRREARASALRKMTYTQFRETKEFDRLRRVHARYSEFRCQLCGKRAVTQQNDPYYPSVADDFSLYLRHGADFGEDLLCADTMFLCMDCVEHAHSIPNTRLIPLSTD